MRGLWIVDAEGERLVCRFERRAVVLCSLIKSVKEDLGGMGMGRGVCTYLAAILVSKAVFLAASSVFAVVSF